MLLGDGPISSIRFPRVPVLRGSQKDRRVPRRGVTCGPRYGGVQGIKRGRRVSRFRRNRSSAITMRWLTRSLVILTVVATAGGESRADEQTDAELLDWHIKTRFWCCQVEPNPPHYSLHLRTENCGRLSRCACARSPEWEMRWRCDCGDRTCGTKASRVSASSDTRLTAGIHPNTEFTCARPRAAFSWNPRIRHSTPRRTRPGS
jgi:hypothetical protein